MSLPRDVHSPTRRWRSSIGARLVAAFGALLLLFVIALAVCLDSFGRIARAEREVETFERIRHAADKAAIAMREQYIHQAHTLIAFDDSHAGHYREIAAATTESVAQLRAALTTSEDATLADDMERAARQSDRTFEERTLPAVRSSDRAEAMRLHEAMEARVVDFERAVGSLRARTDSRARVARADVEAAWARARVASLSCLGFAMLTAAVLGVFLTRSIVMRINAVRDGARRLGAGDLESRIGIDSDDELGELARAFDAMASDLDRHQRELVRSQKLSAMGQVAAGVAHELNNPLGVILGHVKLLRRRQEPDEEALRVIEEEATLASEIVASLLDLTRSPGLRLEDVDLAALARESAARLAQLSRFEGVTWNEQELSLGARVRGDEGRLRQVIGNILTNAAEAVGPAGAVSVKVETSQGTVRLVVDDTGSGIDEHHRAKVTEPFYTTKSDGVGLGLSIVHAIVEAHGGDLTFGRSPLGGARVTVALPSGGQPGAAA